MNQRPLARKANVELLSEKNFNQEIRALLSSFHDFIVVDLHRSKRTAYEKVWFIRRFLEAIEKNAFEVTREDIRSYLKTLESYSNSHYSNTLKALRVFFRDFLQKPDLVATFRLPKVVLKPKKIPTREDLQRFYHTIGSLKQKALFLVYASSGLRKNEVLRLRHENVNFGLRKIVPHKSESETKHTWVSFYNLEAEKVLKEYLAKKKPSRSLRLFPMASKEAHSLWRSARKKTGLQITPKVLREWFCEEMARQGVADRYVDAFCGRTPKSVLARHYSDYSPEKLKAIYDKASLKVLG